MVKNATQHSGRLFPSSADDVALGQAVDEKFIELCNLYQRVTGNVLIPPKDMDNDVFRWRTMRMRHACKNSQCPYKLKLKRECNRILVSPETGEPILRENLPVCGICGRRGDYRHTEAELRSTKLLAQWTVDLKVKLCSQKEKSLEWKE